MQLFRLFFCSRPTQELNKIQWKIHKKQTMIQDSHDGEWALPIKLASHQIDSLQRMHHRETTYLTNSNLGILCDPIGSGKTWTVVAHLIRDKIRDLSIRNMLANFLPQVLVQKIQKFDIFLGPPEANAYARNSVLRVLPRKVSDFVDTTLVIVPHNILYDVWDKTLKQTKLNVYVVNSTRDIKTDTIQKIQNSSYDVVLVNVNKLIKLGCENILWKRVVVDEVDSIRFPKAFEPLFCFFWGVTTTFERLSTLRTLNFVRYMFSRRGHRFRMTEDQFNSILVFSNFSSFALMPYQETKIYCSPPTAVRILLSAGKEIPEYCHLKSNNKLRVKNNYRARIEGILRRQNRQWTYLRSAGFNTVQLCLLLLSLKRSDGLHAKVRTVLRDDAICLNCLLHHRTLFTSECCGIDYCEACKAKIPDVCPSCQYVGPFSQVRVKYISQPESLIHSAKLSKHQTLVELLRGFDKEDRVLLFDEWNYSFTTISETLKAESVSFREVKGNAVTIRKILRDFQSGKTRVLMLNAKHYGAGLNLQNATRIILLSSMNSNVKKQVIGRGHRQGRTRPLHIYSLEYKV